MTRTQYLLCKLAEEASEVSKAALKAQQFGLNEVYPKTGLTNAERLTEEINDLIASLVMLADDAYKYVEDYRAIEKKIDKVEHYLKYSQELGEVQYQD